MNDLIPLGTGNSRFMKSGISPNTTYQQLLTMLINGTFPFDFNGINPAGVSQMGSAYSVANVLPADICAALNIPNTSEPKDAFLQLQVNIETITNIIVASRVGTGKDSSFSVTFPQKPKYVFWLGAVGSGGFRQWLGAFMPGVDIVGTTRTRFYFSSGRYEWNYNYSSWNSAGTSLSFSSPDGSSGGYFNASGTTYYYAYIL